MKKVFSVRGYEIRLKNGSKIEEHPTLDERVVFLLITGEFEWTNWYETMVVRCEKCNSFVLPGENHIPCGVKRKEEIEYEDVMDKS